MKNKFRFNLLSIRQILKINQRVIIHAISNGIIDYRVMGPAGDKAHIRQFYTDKQGVKYFMNIKNENIGGE